MKITYFHRHPQNGFSIQRVFQTLTKEIEKDVDVENIYMPSKGSMPWDIIRNGIYAYRHRNRAGINHITGDVYYLCIFLPRKNLVVTMHDIGFYTSLSKGLKRVYKYIFWILTLKFAEKIVFVSETSKKVVLNHIKLRENRLNVIENPISCEFKKSIKEFNLQKPIVLHLGMDPVKNLKNLIPALEGISCNLRLIGELREEYRQLLQMYNVEYSCISNLTDTQIITEYQNCDIVNFISIHEGFGMPIIEAQATGRVVITGNISPMKEVAGGAAYLVDPYDVSEIHKAYITLINNSALRQELIVKGFKNVEKYKASNITLKYLNLYNEILITI